MTPERLAEIKSELAALRRAIAFWSNRPVASLPQTVPEELVAALETERARLDILAKMRPGARFDALANPRGLRAALDDRIAREREREIVRYGDAECR